MKTYTVIALCLCGCDQGEIHHIDAPTAEAAARQVEQGPHGLRRVVAVLAGKHYEARRIPT